MPNPHRDFDGHSLLVQALVAHAADENGPPKNASQMLATLGVERVPEALHAFAWMLHLCRESTDKEGALRDDDSLSVYGLTAAHVFALGVWHERLRNAAETPAVASSDEVAPLLRRMRAVVGDINAMNHRRHAATLDGLITTALAHLNDPSLQDDTTPKEG